MEELEQGSGAWGGAADLSGAGAAEAAAERQRKCGRGSGSAAEDVSGAIYIVLGYHRRFLIRTVCDN